VESVEALLASLTEQGTIDSTGAFSLNLTRARKLIPVLGRTSADNYILQLISGAIGLGADRVEIKSSSLNLVRITFHQLFVPSHDLVTVYHLRSIDMNPSLQDIGQALRAAFESADEAKAINVSSRCPEKGYRLHFSDTGGPSPEVQQSPGSSRLVVQVLFTRDIKTIVKTFFRRKRFHAPGIDLVQEACCWSHVPVYYNQIDLHDPPPIDSEGFSIQIGDLHPWSLEQQPNLRWADREWSGILEYATGEIELVVNGVRRCKLPHPTFRGFACHPGFKLDATREQVVQDKGFEAFLNDLKQLEVSVIEELVGYLCGNLSTIHWSYRTVLRACLSGTLGVEYQTAFARWVDELSGKEGVPPPRSHDWSASAGLLAKLESLSEFTSNPSLKLQMCDLLEACRTVLSNSFEGQVPLIRGVLDYLSHRGVSYSLVRIYLWLALGALHQQSENSVEAQEAWSKALNEAGQSSAAQTLVRTHTEHGLFHILEEADKALSMAMSAERV
jgi:hypothetical protein